MATPKPTILFQHGAYHPPAVYEPLTSKLSQAGYDVIAPRLPSLGQNPFDVTQEQDVAAVLDAANPLFAEDKKVVMVAHSIGGFLSTIAIKDQTVADRRARGEKGGFAAILYMNSPVTVKHEETVMASCAPESVGMFDVEVNGDGKMVSFVKTDEESKAMARKFFWGGVPEDITDSIAAQLERFTTATFLTPSAVLTSDLPVDFPKTYIVGEKDALVPLEKQLEIIANTPGMTAVRIPDSGHSPFLSHPEKVVEAVNELVARC